MNKMITVWACLCVSQFIEWLFTIIEGPDQTLSATTVSTARGKQCKHHSKCIIYLYSQCIIMWYKMLSSSNDTGYGHVDLSLWCSKLGSLKRWRFPQWPTVVSLKAFRPCRAGDINDICPINDNENIHWEFIPILTRGYGTIISFHPNCLRWCFIIDKYKVLLSWWKAVCGRQWMGHCQY